MHEFDYGVDNDPEVPNATVNEIVENKMKAMKPELPPCHAQDLHAMLGTMLQSYLRVQGTGIDWDLFYRGKE